MENLVIPQISAIGVCIVVVCVFVSILKEIIPFKPLYVWLPLFFSIPFGIIIAYAECGWTLNIIQTALIRTFSICAGSMASYDIITKTIKGWKNNIEKKDE